MLLSILIWKWIIFYGGGYFKVAWHWGHYSIRTNAEKKRLAIDSLTSNNDLDITYSLVVLQLKKKIILRVGKRPRHSLRSQFSPDYSVTNSFYVCKIINKLYFCLVAKKKNIFTFCASRFLYIFTFPWVKKLKQYLYFNKSINQVFVLLLKYRMWIPLPHLAFQQPWLICH